MPRRRSKPPARDKPFLRRGQPQYRQNFVATPNIDDGNGFAALSSIMSSAIDKVSVFGRMRRRQQTEGLAVDLVVLSLRGLCLIQSPSCNRRCEEKRIDLVIDRRGAADSLWSVVRRVVQKAWRGGLQSVLRQAVLLFDLGFEHRTPLPIQLEMREYRGAAGTAAKLPSHSSTLHRRAPLFPANRHRRQPLNCIDLNWKNRALMPSRQPHREWI